MQKRGFTLIDILISLVLLLLLSTMFLRAAVLANEAENRRACAANLKAIGNALLLYSNENKGRFPMASFNMQTADHPTWGTPYEGNDALGALKTAGSFAKEIAMGAEVAPKANDVTAAFYLLLKTQDIAARAFVCPSAMRAAWDFGGMNHRSVEWTNWKGLAGIRDHLSYSYQNPYGSRTAIQSGFKLTSNISAEFAVVADMNPGVDSLLKMTPASPAIELRDGNSLNHSRDGQNVLFGDGHVEFVNTPFSGVGRDNIYTYATSTPGEVIKGGDGIVGSPTGPTDSILLPTAKDIGIINAKNDIQPDAIVKELTTGEILEQQKQLVGRYTAVLTSSQFKHLEITADHMLAWSGPLSASYKYQMRGMRGDEIQLQLSADETRDSSASLIIEQGGLLISQNDYLGGRWTRDASAPKTSPK